MKQKRFFLGMIIWLLAVWIGAEILPVFFEGGGYHDISAATPGSGGGGGYGAARLGSIPWVSNYDQALKRAKENKKPFLIYFKTHEFQWVPDNLELVTNVPDILNEVSYLLVILNRGKDDSYTDELSVIKKLLKTKKRSLSVDERYSLESVLSKEEVKLALKYKVKTLPQLVWCDNFGNKLHTGEAKILFAATPSPLRLEAKSVMQKQNKLKEKLIMQYKPLEKKFETQKETGNFSTLLISSLKEIAAYDGYAQSKGAKICLDEIKTQGEEKFEKLDRIPVEALDEFDAPEIIRIMIARLKVIASNYSGLPAAENALAKIEELEKRLNRKKE